MKKTASILLKSCTNGSFIRTFAPIVSIMLSMRIGFGCSIKTVVLLKDNTPSRLTSVAHLGGLLFSKSLAI